VVDDLCGRGRGVKSTRPLCVSEVVCDYGGRLLAHKEGKAKYADTPEESMGYMFTFKHNGKTFWRDATEEVPGPSQINHSKCHANVSTRNFLLSTFLVKYRSLKFCL